MSNLASARRERRRATLHGVVFDILIGRGTAARLGKSLGMRLGKSLGVSLGLTGAAGQD